MVMLKEGVPTVEEARARLFCELEKARQRGNAVLKLVHGYGSSGVGGRLRDAIRSSLRRRVKEGKVRAYVAADGWDVFDSAIRLAVEACPALEHDRDLLGRNPGVTIVVL